MIQKYTILLDKYLRNQLSYEEQSQFEYTIIHDLSLCEQLKSNSDLPDHIFVKMYHAIKAKLKYKTQLSN